MQVSYRTEQIKDRMGLSKIIANSPPFYIPIQRPSTEDSQKVEIRDLKEKYLKTTIDNFERNNKKERELLFEQAELSNQNKDVKNYMKYLKQAALKGHPEAINRWINALLLVEKQKLRTAASQEKRQESVVMIGRLYQEIGKIDEEKKWLTDCLQSRHWINWERLISILPQQILQEQDQNLLEMLLGFPKNQIEIFEMSNEIGNHLYKLWFGSTTYPRRYDCLKYSAALGNKNAYEEMLKTSLFPRLGLQNIPEVEQVKLHKNILQKLVEDSQEKPFLFSSDVLLSKDFIYRKTINSTKKMIILIY